MKRIGKNETREINTVKKCFVGLEAALYLLFLALDAFSTGGDGVKYLTIVVCLLAAVFFERFRKSSFMTRLMTGVRPACVGMIFGVVFSLCATNYAAELGGVSWPAIAIGALGLLLLVRFKVSIPKVICLSGALGMLLFGVMGLN